jgi:hypothetical protein
MAFSLYDTTDLIATIRSLRVPGTFLWTMFFGAEPITFDTPDVKMDRVFDDLRVAAWQSPYSPGKPRQDIGFQVESFTPGYLNPFDRVDAGKLSSRLPGEPIGGNLSMAERRDLLIAGYLTSQKMSLVRRNEIMASEILRTGAVIIIGEDYPSTTIDFARDESLTVSLINAAQWGEAGVSPIDDVENYCDEVAAACGAAPTIVSFDKLSWQLYRSDPKFEKVIDTTLGQTSAMQLGLQPSAPGSPVFKGRNGSVELYVYNDTYKDPLDDQIKPLIPDYTVIIGAPIAFEGTPTYGAILDPEAGYAATEYWSNNYIDRGTKSEVVQTQSAPLPIPKRVNASKCVTVRTS